MKLTEFAEVRMRCRMILHNHTARHTGAAYSLFQFHMMARLDYLENFKCEDIMLNLEYQSTTKYKIRRSKNLLKELKSPNQIILRSMDPNYCVLLVLVFHFEHTSLTIHQNSSPFLFNMLKQHIQALLEEIVNQEDLTLFNTNSPIGTHSIRELPATYVRRNGCTKDDMEARGRWKFNKRIVDTALC